MSTAIAFLSGKGGSGKTTLALSMADLMSKCKIKTLLIDCDLSTNGATYFFESYLAGQHLSSDTNATSFYDYLRIPGEPSAATYTQINTHFDFFPSISGISDSTQKPLEEILIHHDDLDKKLHSILNTAKNTHDVVLLDCQAGYTNLLSCLLPMMDVDIFVLEADSISASAMRNMHLKAGSYFGHAKIYQVFNKASQEEYETYSKIVGTFFTNIGTLLFDWKIRQAFSRAQIPDLENTSAKYGSDLCDICKVVLTDVGIQKRLSVYSTYLNYRQLEEEKRTVEKNLDELIRSPYIARKKNPYSLFPPAILIALIMLVVMAFAITQRDFGFQDLQSVFIAVITIISLLGAFSLTAYFGTTRESRVTRRVYERRLDELNEKMRRLKNEISGSQNQ